MNGPEVSGIHHIQFLVTDLAESLAWFSTVFGARYQPEFDHHDADNRRYAVIMRMPGLAFPVQLRESTTMAPVIAGYEPVTFGVTDRAALERWATHLDECGVRHSGIKKARIGEAVDFTSPDGTRLRLYTLPVRGYDDTEFVE
ncbi:hypothetical protein GCM10022224_094280 [Nonomuraea antimicrobica]|uniref:VOC domain-containing protein n=1 Tax=Nonomuraea antimicrobica TaxID=561173 RepID=A0ABP7E3J7_9ACTN